jgi:hypothetical protein
MGSVLKKIAVAGALATSIAVSVPARGAPGDDAEAFLKRGVALRRQRNDGAALQEFRRAYEIEPSARAAAQMALAEQALKLYVEADKHLTEALRDRNDPWIRKNRTVLEQQRRTVATHVGRVVVGGEPTGADVFLNGQNAGTIPLREPATVPPGPVQVEVRSPGYVATSMSIVVAAGDQGRVDVSLKRERTLTPPPLGDPQPGLHPATLSATTLPVRPTTTASRGDLTGSAVIEPVREDPDPPDRPVEGASPGLRTARWVMVGATTAFLAAGIAGLVIREHEVGMFNKSRCGVDAVSGNVINRGQPTSTPYCRMLVDNASTGKTVGIVGLAGAGVLAVTTAVLFFAF